MARPQDNGTKVIGATPSADVAAPSTSSSVAHATALPADAAAAEAPTSLTRQFSDMDPWLFYRYVLCLAMCRALLMQPVSVVLTRVRALHQRHRANGGASSAMGQLRQLLRSAMAPKRSIRGAADGSCAAPWHVGLPAFSIGASLSEACYLFQFECSREWLVRFDDGANSAGSAIGRFLARHRDAGAHDFVAALFAEATRQVMIVPFTVLATRQVMVSSTSISAAPSSAGVVGRLLWRERGPRAFFSGLGTSLAIGPIWTASWWWLYAQWKGVLYRSADPYLVDDDGCNGGDAGWRSRRDNTLLNTSASIVASAQAAVFFNPFLVVRTRLQAAAGGGRLSLVMLDLIRDGSGGCASSSGASSSSSATTTRVFSIRALLFARRPLMAGTCLTVAQAVLDGVGASLTYEYAKRWAEQRFL